jgi:hypothetical protein
MTVITEPGIYRDVSSVDYFADPCPEPSLSQSVAKILAERSAWHGRFAYFGSDDPDDDDEPKEKYLKAQAIGNAAHKLLLGRGKDIWIVFFDDFKKADAREIRDAATAAGCVPILEKHYKHAERMHGMARLQLDLHEEKDAFTYGSAEVMIAAQPDGHWSRSLVDWLGEDLRAVDDYKTTQMSVAPHLLGMRAESGGWHIQAAFQERILDILDPGGAGRRRFRFIAQEGYPPYALSVMVMDKHWLTMGRKIVDAAMVRWRQALGMDGHLGHLGYPLKTVYPEYPHYSETRWLEREIAGEFDPANLMAG